MLDGIENNATDFSKVVVAVQDALTQKHSKFKKAVIFFLSFRRYIILTCYFYTIAFEEYQPYTRQGGHSFARRPTAEHICARSSLCWWYQVLSNCSPTCMHCPYGEHNLASRSVILSIWHSICQRQTFLIDSSVKFWDTLDASLSKIRK